eukprot:3395568-Rhodomonas_salina.1
MFADGSGIEIKASRSYRGDRSFQFARLCPDSPSQREREAERESMLCRVVWLCGCVAVWLCGCVAVFHYHPARSSTSSSSAALQILTTGRTCANSTTC